MANNQDALDAIIDIKEAIAEYGSDIEIATYGETAYDPYNGASETETKVATKALISKEATAQVGKSFDIESSQSSYDLSMKLYTTDDLTKRNKIYFRGLVYDIVYVSDKILQNELIIYEILVRK